MISNLGISSDHIVFNVWDNLTQNAYTVGQKKSQEFVGGQVFNPITAKLSLQYLAKINLPSLNSVLTIGLSEIRTIKQGHNSGILHLYIKPQNIMIPQLQIMDSVEYILISGNAQLIDFCLSINLGNDSSQKQPLLAHQDLPVINLIIRNSWVIRMILKAYFMFLADLRKIKQNHPRRKFLLQRTKQKAFQLMNNKWIAIIKDQVYQISMVSQQFLPNFISFIYRSIPYHLPQCQIIIAQRNYPQLIKFQNHYLSKQNELEDQKYFKIENQSPIVDGDARAIIISDLIKAYTTIGIKFIQKIPQQLSQSTEQYQSTQSLQFYQQHQK